MKDKFGFIKSIKRKRLGRKRKQPDSKITREDINKAVEEYIQAGGKISKVKAGGNEIISLNYKTRVKSHLSGLIILE